MKRTRSVQQVLWITLGFNLLVSISKIITGYLGNITSVLADGYHSLADASSNVVGLIGLSIANKPIDFDHSYGHQRYETLATLFIVVMLVILGVQVSISAITNLLNPSIVQFDRSIIPVIVIAITFVINLVVATYQRMMGNKLKSSFLKADAKHTLSDVFVGLGVLINLLLINVLDAPLWFDSITSLLIAFFIFKTALTIFNESSHELTDAIALDPQDIIAIVSDNPQVLSIHKVRSRKSGNLIFVDFHVQCNPTMSLIDAHTLSHDLQLSLRKNLNPDINLFVHVEPQGHPYNRED
jgi:cation diffusion facilitator family transporter